MGKLLAVLVIAVVVWWMWRKLQQPARDAAAPPPQRPVERMVSCAHCGVNQPLSESVERAGRYYCSAAHLRAAEQGEGRSG